MQKPNDIVIDGKTYTIGHWDVAKAIEVWAWLVESLGPGVKEAFEKFQNLQAPQLSQPVSTDKSDEQTEADLAAIHEQNVKLAIEVFGIIVETLRANVPPKEYADRLLSFCSDVLVNNAKLNPKVHFQGNLLLMHRVVAEVLRYQYADFFDEALSLLKR
jgi:translation initiation factor 2 beta subunit (eIF-2beta)/eIF-5